MRWSHARGSEVVDTSTAESIGRIEDVIIDSDRSCIIGVVVGQKILPLSEVGGIGTDALTVPDAGLLREPENDTEQAAVVGATGPLSKPVYTEDGYTLGPLQDLEFDAESGEITRVILAGDDLSGGRLLGVGSFAVMVTSPDRVGGDDDLEQLTKAELYERAQADDIGGRSTMSKDELIAALR